MGKRPEPTPELLRQREHHGWSFRGYPAEVQQAIRHYIATGEKTDTYQETFNR
jgi:hypothetical protein